MVARKKPPPSVKPRSERDAAPPEKAFPAVPVPETEFAIPSMTKAEIRAIQAVGTGTANAGQQVTAMKTIVNKFADYGGVCVDPQKALVHAGQRFVGVCIVQTLNVTK